MKICVCLHLYYLDMIPEMKKYLCNIDEYDLYITTPAENVNNEEHILKEFSGAKIIYTNNVGFDMYPFVCFLKEVDLSSYDLIVKLHTKKDIPIEYSLNGFDLSSGWWRYYLLNPILGTKKSVKKVIKLFVKNKKVGLVGSKELLIRDSDIDKDIDMNCVNDVMNQLGLQINKKEFIAGSIFIIRANLLLPLQKKDYKEEDFPPYLPRTWNELPYCLERCFGMMISSQGYDLVGLYSDKTKEDKVFMLKSWLKKHTPRLFSIFKKIRQMFIRKTPSS